MQAANRLNNKPFDFLSFSALALIAPPVLWWTLLIVSLTVSKNIADSLGGNVFQIFVLVVCPLLAAFASFAVARRTNSKFYWITAGVGVLFAAVAVLASFRAS
ncbi:MAG TPA: hypothetical protein VGC76_09525 [Pyrinomonadaceae bacterium]|jgi:hypothetical protein